MTESISTAILAVMGKVGFVQKQHGKAGSGITYTYASEQALIEALRPAMIEAGIHMHVLGVGNVLHESYQSARGNTMNRTVVTLTMRFTHAPSQTFIDVEARGEGADAGDKSTPKAMTGAYKYALRQTFCIETGDDPDHESSEGQERASRAVPRPPGGAPAQAAPLDANDAPECEECGRVMGYRTGSGAKGPWRGWFCPQGKACQGKPRWLPTKMIGDLADGHDDVPFEA